jgi:DNA-binding CsgD family transcriptional regulator
MKEMKENFLEPLDFHVFLHELRNRRLPSLENPMQYFADVLPHIHKFAVGPYCWIISDMTTARFIDMGGMVEHVMGVKPEQLFEKTEIMMEITHPDDVMSCTAFSLSALHLKKQLPPERRKHLFATLFCRMKNRPDGYGWVMYKIVEEVFDEAGNMLYILTVMSDVSHLKTEGEAIMTLFDSSNEENQVFYCLNSVPAPTLSLPVRSHLTIREREILLHIAKGKMSKEIARELDISIKTVDNHRQNLLRKTHTTSSPALVMYAVQKGWL